jgi:hypothetical protein
VYLIVILNPKKTKVSAEERGPSCYTTVRFKQNSLIHQEVKDRDERLKKNQKEYADSKRRVKCADIKKRNLVLVRQPKSNKMSTKYDPIPYEVTNRRGIRISAIRNGQYII